MIQVYKLSKEIVFHNSINVTPLLPPQVVGGGGWQVWQGKQCWYLRHPYPPCPSGGGGKGEGPPPSHPTGRRRVGGACNRPDCRGIATFATLSLPCPSGWGEKGHLPPFHPSDRRGGVGRSKKDGAFTTPSPPPAHQARGERGEGPPPFHPSGRRGGGRVILVFIQVNSTL